MKTIQETIEEFKLELESNPKSQEDKLKDCRYIISYLGKLIKFKNEEIEWLRNENGKLKDNNMNI